MDINRLRMYLKRGDHFAAFALAILIQNDLIEANGDERIVDLLSIAAKSFPAAKCELAKIIAGRPEGVPSAIRLLREALADGEGRAATLLALMYDSGMVYPPNSMESENLLRQAATLGDPSAYTALFRKRDVAIGSYTDNDVAQELLTRAVQGGDVTANSMLAKIYLEQGSEVSTKQAIELLVSGAECGDLGCSMMLARIYRHGLHGIAKDYNRADLYHQRSISAVGKPTGF